MAGRVQYSRQAAGRVSYADLSDSEGSEAGESEEEQKQVKKCSKRAMRGRKGKSVQKLAENDSSGDEASDEADEPEDDKPRKKRAKRKTKSKGKGKAKQASAKKPAKLEIFKRLPLELLCEVFSHLAPNNLLALSKVNKQFHDLLMSKGSESIWTAARRRLKMPDIEGLTEPQYAELIFGKKCQNCYGDKVGKIYHDFHIRRNLCKKCRQLKILRAKDFAANEPDLYSRLHPFALECAVRTPHSGTGTWDAWKERYDWVSRDWVFLDDLWRIDAWLSDLDDQDEDSDIAAERESSEGPRATEVKTTRHSNRKPNRPTKARASYKDLSDSEEEPTFWISRRAKRWKESRTKTLADRKKVSAPLYGADRKKTADELWKAFGTGEEHMKQEARLVQKMSRTQSAVPDAEPVNWTRKRAIVARFCAEHPEHRHIINSERFGIYRALNALARGRNLTDEEWPAIETKLVPLVVKAAARASAKKTSNKRSETQLSLFTRYEALKKSLPERAQPFMPLFVDFLLLPSIQSLWSSGKAVTDRQWQDKLDEIREEVDDYRVHLCVQTRGMILDATTDRTARAAADELDETEALADEFFQLATSFVCCAFPGCPSKQGPARWRWNYWQASAEELRSVDTRVDWIGPLVDVLHHQHRHHNHEKALEKRQEKLVYPPTRVCLPLEVAGGIISILELHSLDEGRAKKEHLMRANKFTSGYKWVNSKQHRFRFDSHERYYEKPPAWSTILAHIKLEGEKLAKSGLYLDPPNIAFLNKFDKKKVIEMTEDELDSEDHDGGGDDDSADEEDSAEEDSAEQNMEGDG